MTITDADKILKHLVFNLYKDLYGCNIRLRKEESLNHAMESELSFFGRYTINISQTALALSDNEFTVCLSHQLSKIVAFRRMSLLSKIKDMLFSRYSPSYFIGQEKRAKNMTAKRSKQTPNVPVNNQ